MISAEYHTLSSISANLEDDKYSTTMATNANIISNENSCSNSPHSDHDNEDNHSIGSISHSSHSSGREMEQEHITMNQVSNNSSHEHVLSFPQKLYAILEKYSDRGEYIAWNKDGKLFRILDEKQFEKTIIPEYFQRK